MVTSAAGDRGTTINRVRLHGTAGLDALAARLRAGRALQQAADRVTLPAGAILCIRRLRDPRPRHVTLAAVQAPPEEWARAVAQAMADLARRAARPASGDVAADAEAVIFDDRAQLLACLAADWCHGALSARWWWRALIGAGSGVETVVRTWLQHPACIAAAVDVVARLGHAAAFATRLPERETALLLESIVTTHGLDRRLAQTRVLAASPSPGASEAPIAARREVAEAAPIPVSTGEVLRPDAPHWPWRQSAPEACIASLPAGHQQFLGVALTLRRDPARVREATFVQQVVTWQHTMAAPTPAAPATPKATARLQAPIIDLAVRSPRDGGEQDLAMPPAILNESPPIEIVRPLELPPLTVRTTDVAPASVADVRHASPESPLPVAEPQPAVSTVETWLGGVFYLLNVALALGLYGDFTAPRGPRLAMSIWRFIALVAHVLLGHRHRRDAIWPLLAELAGPERPSEEGTGEWRLDPAWLAPFPESRTWRWSADAQRIRVRHPAGFVVVDVTRNPERSPVQQARDELLRYRAACAFRLVRGQPPRARSETRMARWTRWHVTYTRARLARALDAPAPGAVRLLLRHQARVSLSLTHVEVAFSLCDLPIAVRLSGLDRDPGWIPAADRVVSFRYD
jgi:hypothetical protein